eukprot:gnl/MRDRNA2_/MRDRNA2_86193_c0_seq2.p1 gnl/MRDRNA2_/MRDRNA2_86193_c0~~gnl/MRDRNA2_/MRDRNA2_86193_c0_seq2.p1  ORF type:complete len:111 (+),score=9.12 gnl/MRDRNA2_/MRDRNA2_86193_c0_seq2:227-559(+)
MAQRRLRCDGEGMHLFDVPDLAASSWALSLRGRSDFEPLLDAIASQARPRLSASGGFSMLLTSTVWSLAPLAIRNHGPLLESISASAIALISEFQPQVLSNFACAVAGRR